MLAAIASTLWNTGRRACALLLVVVLYAAAQSPDPARDVPSGKFSCLTLESVDALMADGTTDNGDRQIEQQLTWRSGLDGIQKISVSAPRVPGLWIRLISDRDEPLNWRFVTLETGRPRDLLFGPARSGKSVWLHYDFLDSSFRQGVLPIVFTLTEG